jgi:LmbE family N-acetylglucosaminyl deacetylase
MTPASGPMTPASGPMTANLPVPGRALAIGAHPDDIEFGCGATLAKWASADCQIALLVCTDGSKGSWDPAADPAELVLRRRAEQRAAAQVLHHSATVVFLGWTDGELESGVRQRFEIAAWIRRLEPDVVLGHDPWKHYRLHPDHRNAGWLVTDGVVAARDPLFFPELDAPPHRPSTILLFEPDEVNHAEDVTSHTEVKLAALLEHRSQHRSTMDISSTGADDADDKDSGASTNEAEDIGAFRKRVLERLAENGAGHGFAAAEIFHRIDRV